jgi:hypothetical protein
MILVKVLFFCLAIVFRGIALVVMAIGAALGGGAR